MPRKVIVWKEAKAGLAPAHSAMLCQVLDFCNAPNDRLGSS